MLSKEHTLAELWGDGMSLSDFNLITDRTQADVDRRAELKAKGWPAMTTEERAEWVTPLKGSYSYVDMNRVEGAVEYVANKLAESGYIVRPVVKKNWSIEDKPTISDLNRYLKNVEDIRAALTSFPSTPSAPTTRKKLNYQMANDIEQILIDVDTLVNNMIRTRRWCGELVCGEVLYK